MSGSWKERTLCIMPIQSLAFRAGLRDKSVQGVAHVGPDVLEMAICMVSPDRFDG